MFCARKLPAINYYTVYVLHVHNYNYQRLTLTLDTISTEATVTEAQEGTLSVQTSTIKRAVVRAETTLVDI